MRLLLTIAILIVSCVGCGRAEGAFDEARIRTHFAANETAFNALAAEAEKYPDINGASFCPDQACVDRIILPNDQEFWTPENISFKPYMQALNYPGYFFWRRRVDGSLWIPNLGGWRSGEFWIHYSLVAPKAFDEVPDCSSTELDSSVYISRCYSALNKVWAIEKTTINGKLVDFCAEAQDACIGHDYNTCLPEQCRR